MILPFDPETGTVRCGIGTLLSLCHLPDTLRGGDDSIDPRERVRWHNRVSKAKADEEGGVTEVSAKLSVSVDGLRFHLSGRADVVCPDGIWEVKTRLTLPEKPDSAHLLQLCFYMKALGSPRGVLLYTDPDTGGEAVFPVGRRKGAGLWRAFINRAADLVNREWLHHRTLVAGLEHLSFPFPGFRPGQDRLVDSVRRGLDSSGEHMIQAPTGTGKTAAVLFGALPPAVKAWNTVFFLTAKNTQKHLALRTAGSLRNEGFPVRAVALSSRKDSCPFGADPCVPETCELALLFGERVMETRLLERLLDSGTVDTAALVKESADAGVCPFETGLCLAQRCDLVICDYNHVFDPSASLKRFFAEDETAGRIDLLVDEAGNLPDRVMKIWSPEIKESWLRTASGFRGKTRRLSALIRPWKKLFEEASASLSHHTRDDLILPEKISPPRVDFAKWRRVLAELEDPPPGIRELYRAVARFSLVAERLDGTFHLLARREDGETIVRWFCSDPSGPTGEVHRRCRSVTAFSATLSPVSHFRPLLGMGEEAEWTATEWPFPAENLRVWIDATIDTRWRFRGRATMAIAERLRGARAKTPGTWLAWFPSFDWMEEAAAALRDCAPLVQPRVSTPAERKTFLTDACSGDRLVLTVTGSVFSEGVDLSFPDLRGGFAVGPSLPSVSTTRELMRKRLAETLGDGFLHAYVIPGMNRVIQAAGRLVRNPAQKAELVLLGRRFLSEPYFALLPHHWMPVRVITTRGVRMEKGEDRSLPPMEVRNQ